MKRVALPLLIVAGLTTSALAADMAKKAPPAPPPPPPSPWDVAITAAVMNDYNFRGVTQSRHQPSVQGGFELNDEKRTNPNETMALRSGQQYRLRVGRRKTATAEFRP